MVNEVKAVCLFDIRTDLQTRQSIVFTVQSYKLPKPDDNWNKKQYYKIIELKKLIKSSCQVYGRHEELSLADI